MKKLIQKSRKTPFDSQLLYFYAEYFPFHSLLTAKCRKYMSNNLNPGLALFFGLM